MLLSFKRAAVVRSSDRQVGQKTMPPAPRENRTDRDREIERNVQTALSARHIPSLRRLKVSAQEGAVTVHGSVRSFYEKQIVNHCCQDVAGVNRVHNAVDVAGPEFRSPAFA